MKIETIQALWEIFIIGFVWVIIDFARVKKLKYGCHLTMWVTWQACDNPNPIF